MAEGDTLFNIARYELGKASRWVEIYEFNRDLLGKDFNYHNARHSTGVAGGREVGHGRRAAEPGVSEVGAREARDEDEG